MSTKTSKNRKNKGERERLRKKKDEAQMRLEEMQDEKLLKDEIPMDAPPDDEEMEKEYDEVEASPMLAARPTTFDELDAERQAREKAEKVSEVTYDTQDLVWNILHDYELQPTEKADRIMDVADGFAERVNALVMGDDEIEKSLEQLQIEAILGGYQRSLNLFQKAQDWAEDIIIKRELSGKARKRLQDSDFALPDKRKYPIHDKAHVRNALARAAQQIERGGEAAADAKAALPKIRAAAKKFGIEVSKSAILIEKDQTGDWRWVGRPSNNFQDRQGDIMSKSAHEEYVEFLNQNPEMAPSFNAWHLPYSRTHKVDAWMEHEGVLILSGKLTEAEAGALLKQAAEYDIGMSVAGTAIRNKDDRGVIEKYWLYEVSDLPLQHAANPFTSLETMTKEAGMNFDEKVKYLATYMGSEEEARAFLQKTEQTQKGLAEAGLTSKAVEETPQEAPAAPAEIPAVEETPQDVEKLTKQIAEAVGREMDLEGLNAFVAKAQEALDKVPLLEAALQNLQKARDEEMAELLNPPITKKFAWSQDLRPSAREDTILKENTEDEKLKKANPGVPDEYWLSQATNTVPVQEV